MGEELVLTEDMNQQIKDKVAKVKMLMEKSRMLKEANAKKREELEAINAENLILEETCNSLEQQNKDVRAKNSENDGKLKFRFNELITAKKKSLRKLGFKVSLTKHPENNGLMKLKVGFLENSEFYAMFDYCTTFEDYDRKFACLIFG